MNNKPALIRYYTTYAFMLSFFIFTTAIVKAAKYVTVATIGASPAIDKNSNPQIMVEGVIEFWRQEIKQVIPYKPDLILLTECCDNPPGLSNEEKLQYLNVRKNQVLEYFGSIAKANHCYFAFGTQRMADDGMWRISSVLLDREGKVVGIYDKNFPVDTEMESGVKAGNTTPIFECDFGRVVSAICFDLNFDELRQKYITAKPNIILFSSMYHGGDALQSTWAYSCRSFFVGSTSHRIMPSQIRNPLGEIVASNNNYFDFAVAKINLDYRLAHLDKNWAKLRALKEKYKDDVTIIQPGEIGCVLITSEHKTISAEEMTKEFQIELLDDYFNRTRKLAQQSSERKK